MDPNLTGEGATQSEALGPTGTIGRAMGRPYWMQRLSGRHCEAGKGLREMLLQQRADLQTQIAEATDELARIDLALHHLDRAPDVAMALDRLLGA